MQPGRGVQAASHLLSYLILVVKDIVNDIVIFFLDNGFSLDGTASLDSSTATDQEKLRIFGEQRMNLIFDILSKDLIETHGVAKQFDDHLVLVSNRVAEATGNDQEFTRFTLDSLIKSGYVKTDVKGDQVNYFWTHNAKTVHYDLAHA